MRSAMVQLVLVIIGITSIHAVRLFEKSSFHVRMFPATGVEKVLAIQGRDTVEMSNINGEYYLRSISPGYWRIAVKAKAPYEDAGYETTVRPGTDTDLGQIRLREN